MRPTESESSWLDRLSELPPSERAEFLHVACRERPGLRERLQDIVAALADGDPAKRTSRAPASDADRTRILELALIPGDDVATVIGPYKLLQKIGEGGFGTVWMAEQQEPVRRRVALKVVKRGMDTREVIARFEAERQALALMDHPNIAHVFEAGETESGRPYFVMELVRGIPITKYCNEHRVPTDARLRLFIAVCHAVQHAHQKGVIHRDLKPSNIIVTRHDGVPVPKIIDFGIAKAIEAPLTPKTLFTQFHAFIGTPAYTSPEQMELSGLDVDTRSDIYSLGVLLYELLTGHPPFDPDALLKSGLEEMRRTIREVEPPRPSHRLRTLAEDLRTTVARQRGTEAAELTLLLRGDLDWIVMRCLEKDRTRRYDTANALAADVQRFLANEPVSARPPSAVYGLRKFVRRHRVGFAASVAVATALLAALVISAGLLVRERAARERAVAAEAKEATLRQRSEQIAQFMMDMLKGVRPSIALGRDRQLLREIVDATVRRLDTELRNQPAVAADLRATLGSVYLDLGQPADAAKQLHEAVALYRAESGNHSAEVAASLLLLGRALRGTMNYDGAEAAFQEALAIRRQRFGPEHPLFADVLYQLAWPPGGGRSRSESRKMMEEVLVIRRKAFGREHADVAQAIAALGIISQAETDHRAAAPLLAEALAIRRRVLGHDHPDVAESLDRLGYSYAHELDRQSEAADAYRESFDIRRRVMGDEHPRVVVALLRFTGQIPAREAKPETIEIVRGMVASQRQKFRGDMFLLAPSLLTLAALEDHPDRNPEQARAMEREARGIIEACVRNGTPLDTDVIDAMWFFAWSRFIGNVPAEAVAMGEAAVTLADAVLARGGREMLFPAHSLGWVYLGLGRYADAARQLETAARLVPSTLGENHAMTFVEVPALAVCYLEANRLPEARRILEAVLASPNTRRGDAPTQVAFAYCQLGLTLLRESRFVEAEARLREALVNYARPGATPLGLRLHPVQRATSGLGQALAGQGKFDEAEPLVVRAFEELKAAENRIAGDRARIVGDAGAAVLALYQAWGRPGKVAEWKARLGGAPVAPP